MSNHSSRSVSLFAIVGFCSFISLMLNGIIWIINVCGGSWPFLGTLASIASTILFVIAAVAGWIWLDDTDMNRTLKIVLKVLFIIFAILSICGAFGWGI